MPTNTKYAPPNYTYFDAGNLQYNARGVKVNPALNTTTNLDLYFSEDHLITGFWVIATGATLGDKIDLQVVDTDNIFGAGADTVVKQFATNIYLPTSFNEQFEVVYPAKIFAGLTLRLVYHSTALLAPSPFIAVNYKLHKVLV